MNKKFIAMSMFAGLFLSNSMAYSAEADTKKVPSALQTTHEKKLQKININQADEKALLQAFNQFKGIGKQRVSAVIAYREAHQKFNSLDELAKVKGFSDKFVKSNIKQLEALFSLE